MQILVGLDGSEAARTALDIVACLPLTPADRLVLLSVVELESVSAHQLRRRQGEDLERLLLAAWAAEREAASRELEDMRRALGTWPTPVRQLVRGGPAIRTIAAVAVELPADLVVVGPRGRGGLAGLTGLVLGSVAEALPGRLPCPVLIARPPVGAPERVLLGVDGSTHAAEAGRCLAAYPLAGEALVTVVAATPASRGRAALAASAEAIAVELAAKGIGVEVALLAGDPRRVLIQEARSRRSDLLAVGSRGGGWRLAPRLGSVSRHVVAHAPCSVLVAPPPAPGALRDTNGRGREANHPPG